MRTRVIIGIVIGVLAVFYFCIPNFCHRGRHNPGRSCIINLRLLDSAKEQLALENKLPPGSVVDPTQLKSYLGRGFEGEIPKCPSGGTYTLNPIGEPPTCSIQDHTLPP